MIAALHEVCRHYLDAGFHNLDYRPVPAYVRPAFGDEDVYSIFQLGGTRSTCRLGALVDLRRHSGPDTKGRNLVKKAERAGLTLTTDFQFAAYWALLTEELEARFGARPVHALAEIELLHQRFPRNISLHTVTDSRDQVVAGAVMYRFGRAALHTQYLAANYVGRANAAMNLLCERLIAMARDEGLAFFSFGSSTESGGLVLNSGLYEFKYSFGATGVVSDAYVIDLSRAVAAR
jgi:hypothetical protein